MKRALRLVWLVVGLVIAACGQTADAPASKTMATASFLADIAQNVAGDRLTVVPLLPAGVEPHGYQPTPSDVTRIAKSTVLIINGSGLEEFLDRMLANAGGTRTIINASAGLTMRERKPGERRSDHGEEGDPHFWLDPVQVIRYAENIRDGFSQADPVGATAYAQNAEAYIKRLQELDDWIRAQVQTIPARDRLLVTNHESLGYFADRYGFTVVGTVLQSASTTASPTAQELAALIGDIRRSGARALFLETGASPQLARQIAQETGVRVVQDLNTHAVSKDGGAGSYIDMMRQTAGKIVEALR